MLKKIIITFFVLLFSWIGSVCLVQAETPAPVVNCIWLPWCTDTEINNPKPAIIEKNIWVDFVWRITSLLIQIVAVFAVFALIFSWVLYLISAWNEEKTNKAKKWIIWSLVWVFLSISAWWIISFINGININI